MAFSYWSQKEQRGESIIFCKNKYLSVGEVKARSGTPKLCQLWFESIQKNNLSRHIFKGYSESSAQSEILKSAFEGSLVNYAQLMHSVEP